MKCACCQAEMGNVQQKPTGKGGLWPLCGTCRYERDTLKDAAYSALLKKRPIPPLPSNSQARPRIGFEIETTIRVRNISATDEKISSVTWNKHRPYTSAPPNGTMYDGTSWALTLDLDAVTKLRHVEYVTQALELGSEARRNELIRSLSDIAELSRYYYTYMLHKQGDLGKRMDHQETWVAFGHAMSSPQQQAWLEERFTHSSLNLKAFSPGELAYMVEGLHVPKIYTWRLGRPERLLLSTRVRGAPQATVDIPTGQVFRFLEAMSEGSIKSITLSDQEPVPLFRHLSQAEALRDIVGKVRLLQMTEAQRGLVAMMAFYLRVSALQKIKVTFCKEAYPILNRCGFAAWLKLVGDNDFNGSLKGHLRQVTGIAIDKKITMIPADKCPAVNQQNPFREEWVDSVLVGTDEKLMLNTKHGWWPIKGDQLLAFELRGLPGKLLVEEWRPLLVGLYDWFHEFLADEKMAPAMNPVRVAVQPLVPRVMPPIYYEMKEQGRLTQEMVNRAQSMQTDKASHGEIDRFLRQGNS